MARIGAERVCSVGHNGAERPLHDHVDDAFGLEKGEELRQAIGGHEEHRLSQIPHSVSLDEARIPVCSSVRTKRVSEDESADPPTLRSIATIYIPRDHEPAQSRGFLPSSASDGSRSRHSVMPNWA